MKKCVPKLKAVVKVSMQSYVETQVLLGKSPREAYEAYKEMTQGLACPEDQVAEPIRFFGSGTKKKIVFPGEALYAGADSIFSELPQEDIEGEDDGTNWAAS